MTNTELLKIAQKHLGQGGARFRKYCGLPSGAAWCNAFVDYVANEGGVKSLYFNGAKETYCPHSIKWCNKNLALIPLYLAMPMDIIYFDWDRNGNPNHIGFVRAHKDTSSVYTIEGNTNGGVVAQKTRPSKYVQGIYRPMWSVKFNDTRLAEDGNFQFQSIGGLQKALKILGCYTGEIDTILGQGTVKSLQKYVGITGKGIDGAWGKTTSLKTQQMLIKKGFLAKGQDDGAFGVKSCIALQKFINSVAYASQPTLQPTPTPPKEETYTGALPNLVTHSGQKIAYTARDLSWAKGTKKAKYTYPKGKAKASFTKAINAVYPNRKKWSAQCRAGASCDVGAGTIIRYSGIDKNMPRGLSEQIPHLKKSSLWRNTGLSKVSQAGDVGIYNQHIWIGLGDGNIAEANHTWKFFEHIVKDRHTKSSSKKNWAVYRATKASAIQNGDRGTEVKKLQTFLNWGGFNCGAVDGEVGEKTISAIKAFQTKVGLPADGAFGQNSLNKAKTFKR